MGYRNSQGWTGAGGGAAELEGLLRGRGRQVTDGP